MINFRYHLVSLAAVLFALAAGVALGAGVFKETLDDTGIDSSAASVSPQLVGFDAGYASLTAESLLKGELKGRTVLVMSLPNAREAEVNSITEYLRLSGAEVTGQIQLTPNLLSPAKKQFVEGIATQANPDASSLGGSYGLIGSTLAAGYLDKQSREVGDVGSTIRAAFVEGELVQNVKEPGRKAELAVLVSGAPRASDDDFGDVLSLIVTELDNGSNGVVIAGPVASGEDGIVSDIRASDAASQVSTVDVTDLATGRVTTVLALVHEAQGKSGSWGTSRSTDGPVPN